MDTHARCRFYTREAAANAMDRLHQQELPDFPGTKVRIQPSQAKHKLFIGGIPHELTREGLRAALEPVVKGGWGCLQAQIRVGLGEAWSASQVP
jgi:hypothetical protein